MSKTNLEQYKKELGKMLYEGCFNPAAMFYKIKTDCDSNIRSSSWQTYADDILDWMAKPYKESILDDTEKEYLSAVIKPFRKKVMDVAKIQYRGERQSIRIRVSYGNCAVLPFFKNNTMYKGMEVGKYYTPEELGL